MRSASRRHLADAGHADGRTLKIAITALVVVVVTFGLVFSLTPSGAISDSTTAQGATTPTATPEPTSTYSAGTEESGTSSPSAKPRPRKPNVLMVLMDDMRDDDLRYMPQVRKHLLQKGLRFRNSFSPFPLCCPARASMVTGKYAHNHRVLYHDEPYGFGVLDDSRSLATAMQRAGYQTGFTGKYLNMYGRQDSLVTGKSSITYVPNGWTDWRAGLDTLWGPGSPYHGNTYDYNNFTQNVNGRTVANPGEYSSTVIADDAIEMSREYARSTRPWFMWVNPIAPHHGNPIEPDDPTNFVTADGRFQEFPTPARPEWVKGRFDKQIRSAPGVPPGRPTELDVSDKPNNIRRFPEVTNEERIKLIEVARQRAESVFAWDHEFGRMVRQLKRSGEWRDTVVIFTSDNGYFLGEHRQRVGKIKPYEPSIHVPLVIAGPGIPRGQRLAPITTMDLTRTILDLAGAPRRALPRQDGRSRLDLLYGKDRDWTTPMLTEGLLTGVQVRRKGFGSGLTEIGVRTGQYKFLRYANGDVELYDLFRDPLELQSVHRDPAYRQIRRDLARLWRQTKDCRGQTCHRPLPKKYQVSSADLRTQLEYDTAERRRYYGPNSRALTPARRPGKAPARGR